MALSRPFVLAALAALLCAATFVSLNSASQQASADSGNDSAPVVTGVPTPKPSTTSPKKTAPAQTSTTPKATPSKAAPTPKAKSASTAKSKATAAKSAAATGVPPRLKRALDRGHTVVLFFRQGAADDNVAGKAVNAVQGMRGVKVFRDGIDHLARYRRVVADLGITQAPAVIVIGKDKKATVFQGYVDSGTLKQQVEDAR